MTTTTRVNVTDDVWTELSNGSANVTLDLDLLERNGPDVMVRVGETNPGVGETHGIRLTDFRPTFPLAGLSATDKVYARAVEDDANVYVIKS